MYVFVALVPYGIEYSLTYTVSSFFLARYKAVSADFMTASGDLYFSFFWATPMLIVMYMGLADLELADFDLRFVLPFPLLFPAV